jgi:hypothetical protein
MLCMKAVSRTRYDDGFHHAAPRSLHKSPTSQLEQENVSASTRTFTGVMVLLSTIADFSLLVGG